MKSYDQRTRDILSKAATLKRRRRAITSAVSLCCCMVLIVGALLISPGTINSPNDNKIVATVNNYDSLRNALSELFEQDCVSKDEDLMDGITDMPLPESAPSTDAVPNSPSVDTIPDDSYEEVTDNQVEGVTEADLIKRTNKYIFYLRERQLSVYSIEGLNSKELGGYEIGSELSDDYRVYAGDSEMYLSRDCKTITLMNSCYHYPTEQRYLYILSLDVTNPENIRVNGSCFLTGSYTTSRLVDDTLYIISSLYVSSNADLEDESTFLPGFGTPEDMNYLPMMDIHIPEEPTAAMYSVVTQLNNRSLEVQDSIAMLSYAGEVYMSQNNIYLTRNFTDSKDTEATIIRQDMTEITQIQLNGTGLTAKGTIQLEGSVLNQYSLDEYDGILRVVTTTDRQTGRMQTLDYGDYTYFNIEERTINASLYCIDLTDHRICAKVENFAPKGESVQSVRFDGTSVYVCTSIELQDPVFFFDLSDLDNIRWKDTGTIDGYSMSLVDFADGFLMGIGYGNSRSTLKIEMYREGATTVESHCAYEQEDCWFASDYKSYYIDRNNQLIGLAIQSSDDYNYRYILLHFDGYELVKLLDVPVSGDLYTMRSVYIDGYLYILGDQLQVVAVP